jgi:hypothetical protein
MIAALIALLLSVGAHLSPAVSSFPTGPEAPAVDVVQPAPWMLPPDPVEVDPAQLEPDGAPASDSSVVDAG